MELFPAGNLSFQRKAIVICKYISLFGADYQAESSEQIPERLLAALTPNKCNFSKPGLLHPNLEEVVCAHGQHQESRVRKPYNVTLAVIDTLT
jgi:hypothetical protein